MDSFRSIYILLTRSQTLPSRVIYMLSGAKYTHSSLAFHWDLEEMYSFGRKYLPLPLPAGLKEESLHNGFYEIFSTIPCALFEFHVSAESYKQAQVEVMKMMAVQKVYRYNVLGLALCRLGIPMRRKNKYFCSEFVADILDRSDAMDLPRVPSLIRPIDYASFPGGKMIYEGTVGELSQLIAEQVYPAAVS